MPLYKTYKISPNELDSNTTMTTEFMCIATRLKERMEPGIPLSEHTPQ